MIVAVCCLALSMNFCEKGSSEHHSFDVSKINTERETNVFEISMRARSFVLASY